jgi:hypothetical protein
LNCPNFIYNEIVRKNKAISGGIQYEKGIKRFNYFSINNCNRFYFMALPFHLIDNLTQLQMRVLLAVKLRFTSAYSRHISAAKRQRRRGEFAKAG